MLKLITLGLLAAVFFSSTFVINRALSVGGGHWAWTGALRMCFITIFVLVILALRDARQFIETLQLLRSRWHMWLCVGTAVGGIAYALHCFAALHSPGWVIALVWQSTICATPFALRLYGRRVPLRGITYTLLMFAGIALVQIERSKGNPLGTRELLFGALPVLLSAAMWPTALQYIKEAADGSHHRIAPMKEPIAKNPMVQSVLIGIGALPFWAVTLAVVAPGVPQPQQLAGVAVVAISSGIVGTTLFLHARQSAQTPYQIAAVDATQVGEVPAAMLLEVILISGPLPQTLGYVGLALAALGLILYVTMQQKQ